MSRLALLLAAVLAMAPQAAPLLRLGMTADEVHATLGNPESVSRQILAHRCIEQWRYRDVRLEFDCRRGQRPRLATIISLTP